MQTSLPTEERQAEIVAAASNLARNISPASITTGEVANAKGVTQGAVFKHFPPRTPSGWRRWNGCASDCLRN